jgi:hypothetical protein
MIMYIGMVKSRPTLNNINVPSLYMLESSNTLITSNINTYSENIKDVTMGNQHVSIKNIVISLIVFLYNIRDYTREVISFIWLRYSPIFLKDKNYSIYSNISINKTLRKNLTSSLDKLDPNWVTGFCDAEGCFSVIIDTTNPSKGRVKISFEINLHEKDQDILYKIKSFFGIGNVYHIRARKKSVYRVTNVNNINNVIIPHFRSYPLISKKYTNYTLWSKVINLILNKEHLTEKGFLDILSLYASINRGVSKKVSQIYTDIILAPKPLKLLPDNLNPQWVSGFVAGDGGFSIYVRPAKDYAIGEKVYCRFHIAQHSKDLELMKLFIKFFGCGTVSIRSNTSTSRCDYIVQDTTNLIGNILPHFDSYPLLNLKQKDYKCFNECMTILKLKQHLNQEGLNKIKSLNLEMNSNRLKD